MKILKWAPDGGKDSGVDGFFLIEAKSLFSVVLLRFNEGTREAYHSHAFNAWTLWLKGRVIEHDVDGTKKGFRAWRLKYTPREKFHKVQALRTTWALSFRGPWAETWQEKRAGEVVTLTHGRQVMT